MLNLIQTLKRGSQTWFPFKEVLLCQSHVLAAGIFGVGMGVAGLILAWNDGITGYPHSLLWTSKRRDSSEHLCWVAGLKNLGNNCFLNVILQALSSCSCFHPFLQSLIEANDSVAMGEGEDLPLTVALAALLRELCTLRDERLVVSPRGVMSSLGIYVSSFNLTRQQDAAEALAHLLSSLKEEVSEHYIPRYGSLADISSPGGRFPRPKRESETEWGRWRQHLFGPFDGTLGSILSCKSCSFQLSMDFELFHCLPLSPVMDGSGSIIDGCTVEDCLKQFTASEHIENYRCSQCLHVAAAKYLSLNVEENEIKIKELQNCIKHDSCDCKNLLLSEGMPWPTGYSCAFKQLSIGRCPKIFCIHLQRASVSDSGELIKLQGHISFPLVLDFFPFTAASIGVGAEIPENKHMQVKQQQLLPSHLNFQMKMLPHVYGLVGKQIPSEDKLGSAVHISSHDSVVQTPKEENGELSYKAQIPDLVQNQPCFKSTYTDTPPQYHDEMQLIKSPQSRPSTNYTYRLVSVVEHYGKVGSGHYAVYRRAKALTDADDSDGQTDTADMHWFYVSDAEVSSVSEEDVLAAEASLLFYERIEDC
ncbi:hypothetical protein AAC387_Pa02g4910 [Persea americana]